MALFPRDDVLPQEEAARRRSMTQEAGTRKLIIGFIAVLAIWFIGGRVWDFYLLRKAWPPLAPEETGLTVVGTLDRRGSYDHNLFRIIQSEGETRAEITNFGWASIFSGRHGPWTTDQVGTAIENAIQVDGETGYAMLQPFLAAEVRTELGQRGAFDAIDGDYKIRTAVPMSAEEKAQKRIPARDKTLGELVRFFAAEGHGSADEGGGPPEAAGSSEHTVEHGIAVPAEVLARTCPVVLVSRHFSSGWVEDHTNALTGTTYSAWLNLTPEGRSRFYQWSRNHVDESLLLILNREVVAHGRIAMTMDVPTWEITNLKDGVAARKLVDFVKTSASGAR